MALTYCTDCKRELSTKASSCPHCGCPNEYAIKLTPEETNEIITLKYPNNHLGQSKKINDIKFYTNNGYKILSETINPGKFRSEEACCLALICLPCGFSAGTTDGSINVTLERKWLDTPDEANIQNNIKKHNLAKQQKKDIESLIKLGLILIPIAFVILAQALAENSK